MDHIDELIRQRGRSYGDAQSTHERIAEVWSGILGFKVYAHQVAIMMVGLKLVRSSVNPILIDNYDDAHGYLKIAQQIGVPPVNEHEEVPATHNPQTGEPLGLDQMNLNSCVSMGEKQWGSIHLPHGSSIFKLSAEDELNDETLQAP